VRILESLRFRPAAEHRVTSNPNLPMDSPAKPVDPPPVDTGTALLDPPTARPVRQPHAGAQLWLHRTSVFLFVLISAVAGVLLIILPWTPEWTDNYLLLSFPGLRIFVASGFFRGICSGLGLLDVWIGFWEALHYHEHG
jgi:hypothetical protein